MLNTLIENLPSIPGFDTGVHPDGGQSPLSEREDLPQLKLNPLDPEDARALIRDIIPANPPSEEVVAFVLDRAEGVPLYIEELTRSALEIGLPLAPSARTSRSKDGDIPSSFQSSLLARLDRLGPARGNRTDRRDHWPGVRPPASSRSKWFARSRLSGSALTNLVRSGLIVPKEGTKSTFLFKHALLQQAAQRTILRERCQQLHALIGRTMEMREPEAGSAYPELLARHFADGGAVR